MTASEKDSATLVAAIEGGKKEDASRALGRIKKSCGACHASYRNE